MTFFQSPQAEHVVSLNDFDFLAQLWATWSPHYDATSDVAFVREALHDPVNLSAALGYYRTLPVPTSDNTERSTILASFLEPAKVPTLYLHGHDDGCILASSVNNPLAHLAPGSRYELMTDCGHFLHLERPEAIHAQIDVFLSSQLPVS